MEPQVSSLIFKAHRRTPELISPARPTPQELKIVSDIDDQGFQRRHVRIIFFYKHNPSPAIELGNNKNIDPVGAIRQALAKTLVHYYPFAGRLREGPRRKLMVECNNEGVVFVEADADVALDEFGDAIRPPFPCLEELCAECSTDVLNSPLLLMQVTRLKCGDFSLAVSFNHVICDGTGLLMFLKTLGETARGANAPSLPPVWNRHLLTARVPARVTHAHREYDDLAPETNEEDDMVQRSFSFGSAEIAALRELVPPNLRGCSTSFELLASLLWRCRAVALRKPSQDDAEMRFMCVVNARPFLRSPPLPPGYYGNVVVTPVATTTLSELSEQPLGFALRLVREAKCSVTEEYVRSMTDLLATRGRPQHLALANTYAVSDMRRIGLDDIDFGWGKATYGGVAEGFYGISFFTQRRNEKGEAETLVPVTLQASAMERFAEEIARAFKQRMRFLRWK